jgi:hypothetical protein
MGLRNNQRTAPTAGATHMARAPDVWQTNHVLARTLGCDGDVRCSYDMDFHQGKPSVAMGKQAPEVLACRGPLRETKRAAVNVLVRGH